MKRTATAFKYGLTLPGFSVMFLACAKKPTLHEHKKSSDAVVLSAVSDFDQRKATFSSKGQGGCYVKGGQVHCWGMNDQKQLSLAESSHSYAPVRVDLPERAKAVAASESEACALTDDGMVWCWGRGQSKPDQVALSSPLRQLAGGADNFCGIDAEGKVWCWGNNDFGQSGGDTPDRVESPVEITGYDGNAVSVNPGLHHTCLLTDTREAWCWGRNSHGQLGNGDTSDSYKPVYVSPLQGVASIAPGLSHTCALTGSGKVFCWGANEYGQLGSKGAETGGVVHELFPGQSLQPVGLTVGSSHGCILEANGSVRCWGWNLFGQISEKKEHVYKPEAVFSGVRVVLVVASHYFILAIDDKAKVHFRGLRHGIADSGEDYLRFLAP